jgi:hypothetical protein
MEASACQGDERGSGQIAKINDIDIPMYPIDQQQVDIDYYENKSTGELN